MRSDENERRKVVSQMTQSTKETLSNDIRRKRRKNVGCDPTQLTKLCLHQMQTQKTKKKYGK